MQNPDSKKTALYPGTFNPFTVGHMSIVERTLKLCDRVVIAIGRNPDKPGDDAEANAAKIRSLFQYEPRVEVGVYTGLTVDFAKECGADFMVRGVRNCKDFEYERDLADANFRISGIDTVLLTALPELSCISSSLVRVLEANGRDVSEFLP